MNAKVKACMLCLMTVAIATSLPSLKAQEPSPSPTLTPVYTFLGEADGAVPYNGLAIDPARNLYGTASAGGSSDDICAGLGGCGVVFKIDTRGHESLLYTFTGNLDGGQPYAGVARSASGVLYGAPYAGGSFGNSDVFQLMPRPNFCPTVLCPWNYAMLYSFGSMPGDGVYVAGTLLVDSGNNLYGMNQYGGGGCNCGTVFKVDADGNETIMHTFTGPDGAYPAYGALVQDQAGNIYGATNGGGGNNVGVIFELSPSGSGWTETVLYSFTGGADGAYPVGVVVDSAGNLYGTTFAGSQGGVVFELTRNPDGNWMETVLHTFRGSGAGDGSAPQGAPFLDSQGNIYGTTDGGGSGVPCACGTIYKIDSSRNYSILWNFSGETDGAGPFGNLVMDAQGNLYGTTAAGGNLNDTNGNCSAGLGGCGVVFKLTP